jgi:RNA polymerase sigma-70 factor (ECF subfamily)
VPLDDVDEVIALPSEPVIERIALEQAIATLPLSLRQVFVLFEIERYTHAEIAALLEIRRGTSEVRLYRAIRRLRTCLGDSSK